MNILEQIAAHEKLVENAREAYLKAGVENDPLIKHKENELVRLQSELESLKMRRPV